MPLCGFEIAAESTDTPAVDSGVASVLGEVLERLRRASDRRDGLRALATALQELLPCDAAGIWVQSARHRPFKLWGAAPAIAGDAARPELDARAVAGESELARGECLSLGAAGGSEALRPIRDAMEARPSDAVLLLPLVHQGRLEALASCRTPTPVAREQIATWRQVAPHVATALNAARLQESSARMRAYRSQFASLSADVLRAADVETAAVRLCELTRAIFATTRSALFLLEGEDLVPIAAAGPYGDRAAGRSLHVPPGVEPGFDEAVRTQQVLVINDFRASRYAATPIPLPFRPQAAMVIPLFDGSGTLGVLTASELDEPQRFGPDAGEQGRLLGAVATVAVRRMLLLEELQRAGRAKDEFLATVSHELRTPINIVLGYVQLLTEQAFGPLSRDQADTVARVEKGARNLLALVNDLLDLASIERGAITCDFGPVRIRDLEPELADSTRALIGGRGLAFSSDVPDGLIAWTDRERLKQVLLNVLGNAVKFTTEGSIGLRAFADGERTAIEVVDTGSGMEPGFLGRATEPFVRGDGSSGSGLGLAIVARMLRVLHGSLAIDSQPGRGTSVRILLPSAETAVLLEASAS